MKIAQQIRIYPQKLLFPQKAVTSLDQAQASRVFWLRVGFEGCDQKSEYRVE